MHSFGHILVAANFPSTCHYQMINIKSSLKTDEEEEEGTKTAQNKTIQTKSQSNRVRSSKDLMSPLLLHLLHVIMIAI